MEKDQPATKRHKVSLAENTTGNESKECETSPFQDAAEANVFETPTILAPKNRFALENIINNLDPSSFVKLARTCRSVHDVCFNSNGVKITFSNVNISIDIFELRHPIEWMFQARFYLNFSNLVGRPYEILRSRENRMRIREKYPFVFKLQVLEAPFFAPLDIADVRTSLEEFRIQSIEEIAIRTVDDWNTFIRIIEDFQVQSVYILTNHGAPYSVDDVLPLFQSKLKRITCVPNVPIEAVLQSTVPSLDLPRVILTEDTIKQLIIKSAESTDEIDWSMHIRPGLQFPLIECYKTLPFSLKGPVPDQRPLVFVENDKQWILRKDGKVVLCFLALDFGLCTFSVSPNPQEWPPCFRALNGSVNPNVSSV